MGNKGRTYELDMVREINAATDPRWVHAAVPDHSGNAADTYYDLEVMYYAQREWFQANLVELKKRTADEGYRCIVMSGGNDGETGLEELQRLIDNCPNWGDPWVAIKFDHRELIVLHGEDLHEGLTGDTRRGYGEWISVDPPEWFDHLSPRLTSSDSISMVKPELEWWDSSTAGEDDHLKLLQAFPEFDDHKLRDDGISTELNAAEVQSEYLSQAES